MANDPYFKITLLVHAAQTSRRPGSVCPKHSLFVCGDINSRQYKVASWNLPLRCRVTSPVVVIRISSSLGTDLSSLPILYIITLRESESEIWIRAPGAASAQLISRGVQPRNEKCARRRAGTKIGGRKNAPMDADFTCGRRLRSERYAKKRLQLK